MLPAIVGHRGARGEAPENTLASFRRAVAAGVPEIELDVRLSADRQLFVLHDADLERTTGRRGAAQRKSLSVLTALDARHGLAGWPTPCPVPSLAQVLEDCPPTMRFQLEVKADGKAPLPGLARALAALVQERQLHDRVVVTSSSARFLGLMREQDAGIARGYVCQYRHRKPIQTCVQLDCRWLISHYGLVSASLMKQARRHGFGVSVWTVNDLREAERLTALQVDSIITDFPTAFRHHFQHRP